MKITAWLLSLSVVSLLAASPALSDPPHGKGGGRQDDAERGNGKGKGKDKNRLDDARQENRDARRDSGREGSDGQRPQPSRPPIALSRHFEDRHRSIVREYYGADYRSGHCPPGLARKNNGCMPPGQAKKWAKGQPLPRDIVIYDVPPALVVRIGTPPPGYRYVRVAADILLIAVGTGMVIDAITDLGSM